MAGKKNLDDRQIRFLENYLDPKSKTYTNALQSALKAGFAQQYAESITAQMPDWLSEALGNEQRIAKAEKVFDECLTMNTISIKKIGDEEIEIKDPQLLKIKQDTAKFIAETIGKKKGYTKRQELTGEEGKGIKLIIEDYGVERTKDNSPTKTTPSNK